MYKQLIRKNIASLAPYSTARDEYKGDIGIYLDANENPYNNGYNRYPDPYQTQLKNKISKLKKIEQEKIFIGNGSDEPIDLVYRVFCEPAVDNVVAITPTYGMYKVAAVINNVEYREVQLLSPDYSLDIKKIFEAVDKNTKLIFICSPNNPTANSFPVRDIEEVINKFQGIVVIDEAYIDFSKEESFLHKNYENVIVLQTLSKAWGMAGLRLGLAFASEWVIEVLTKVKYPYNINVVTQAIVLKQLNGDVKSQISEILSERSRVISELNSLDIVKNVYESDANFILIKVDDPKGIYNKLIEKKIIVRNRSSIKGCEGTLRITIGTPDENNRLLEVFEQL